MACPRALTHCICARSVSDALCCSRLHIRAVRWPAPVRLLPHGRWHRRARCVDPGDFSELRAPKHHGHVHGSKRRVRRRDRVQRGVPAGASDRDRVLRWGGHKAVRGGHAAPLRRWRCQPAERRQQHRQHWVRCACARCEITLGRCSAGASIARCLCSARIGPWLGCGRLSTHNKPSWFSS